MHQIQRLTQKLDEMFAFYLISPCICIHSLLLRNILRDS